jgi:type IV secretion system protein VirB10
MTALPHSDGLDPPRPKQPIPPLDARAPRPQVVRLRRSVVTLAVMSACGLLAGALAWAFIVEPSLRERAAQHKLQAHSADGHGAVRPSELVTDHPATYGQLDQLPPPRQLGVGLKPAAAPSPPATPTRNGPTVMAEARKSQLFFGDAAGGGRVEPAKAEGGPAALADRDYGAVYNGHSLLAPLSPYEVKAGAILPAALLTAVDTAREGPVVATVTENVFDTVSGRTLLIPQGSRLIGRHEGQSRYGDKRAFVAWERLILPNGKSLVLSKEPGVDAQGAVGVEGRVDRRIGPLVVATLFAGAITTLGQVARDHHDHSDGGGSILGDAGDAAAIEAAQIGGKLIDRELDVHPQISLKPGSRIRVLITRDLILEPYQP